MLHLWQQPGRQAAAAPVLYVEVRWKNEDCLGAAASPSANLQRKLFSMMETILCFTVLYVCV